MTAKTRPARKNKAAATIAACAATPLKPSSAAPAESTQESKANRNMNMKRLGRRDIPIFYQSAFSHTAACLRYQRCPLGAPEGAACQGSNHPWGDAAVTQKPGGVPLRENRPGDSVCPDLRAGSRGQRCSRCLRFPGVEQHGTRDVRAGRGSGRGRNGAAGQCRRLRRAACPDGRERADGHNSLERAP